MNVPGVSYNGSVQKEWKTIEPLQDVGSQDLLKGVQLDRKSVV